VLDLPLCCPKGVKFRCKPLLLLPQPGWLSGSLSLRQILALQQVKTLQGLLPICASCKKVRDDGGYWHQVEIYMHQHTGIEFSHAICPDCREKLYPAVPKRGAPVSQPALPLSS
jgi:hypothetical protein